MKRVILLFLFLTMICTTFAQKLTVESFEVKPMDLSASTSPRLDKNDVPCALVKVLMVDDISRVVGNVIGEVENRGTEKWVYLSADTKMMKIVPARHVPLTITFADYGVKAVESKVTYELTLTEAQAAQQVQTQKLVINYTPKDAMVLIDSEPQQGNGHVEVVLPLGEHAYMIAANGYITAEGTVKLNGGSQRVITEQLEKKVSATVATVQQPLQNVSAPIVQTPQLPVEPFSFGGVSFRMVRVDGGTFQMGSNDSDADSDEKPVHQVTLSDYYIGETEVTQALWEAVMGSTVRQQRDKVNTSWSMRGEGPNYPMYFVSWEECQEFVEKLNAQTGRTFRLPTEAEWEYAARGGNKPKGYKYSGSDDIGSVAWYDGNSGNTTHEVKKKQANELGLYDMSGNVWEWCQDRKGDYSNSAQTNPIGPSSGSNRVYRGGSWYSGARTCRSSYRNYDSPSIRGSLGFRLAL